jgi:hypothetical protein
MFSTYYRWRRCFPLVQLVDQQRHLTSVHFNIRIFIRWESLTRTQNNFFCYV